MDGWHDFRRSQVAISSTIHEIERTTIAQINWKESMNRIYQGRVAKVEVLKPGTKGKSSDDWKPLDAWADALWEHHQLFQDAVNYYTLALAAMTEGLSKETVQGVAALAWREEVKKTWLRASRKSVEFDGPHSRLARWLGIDATFQDESAAFEAASKAVLHNNGATVQQRAAALLQLLEEADKSDLNQFAVGRLPWLCTPKGALNATPHNVVAEQEAERIRQTKAVHSATQETLAEVVEGLEPGRFVTQMPTDFVAGDDARQEAIRQFASASKKVPVLASHQQTFVARLIEIGDALTVPSLGRRPSGIYPFALVLKLWPSVEAWDAFKEMTRNLATKDAPPLCADAVANARQGDEPLFDYFTNKVMFRSPESKERAVWFEFDLAAFIEAVKAPHRYFEDTQARAAASRKLREKLHAIDPEGGWLKNIPVAAAKKLGKKKAAPDDEEGETPAFTFAGDRRIAALRTLVTDTLGWLAEAEHEALPGQKTEYAIQERTLRGWRQVREAWIKRAAKGTFTENDLWTEVAEIQGEHRDDFGSATLYKELAKPENRTIWLDVPQSHLHAEDTLRAWLEYTELCFELRDKERPIRFTPAHAEHSPRYYILPKAGRFGTKHERAKADDEMLHFIAGIVARTERGLEPVAARFGFSAPRLRRDELRAPGEGDLAAARWLQPMMQALGIPNPDAQNFANCRVTLQPNARDNHQLTFPVEIETAALIAGLGVRTRWARQFNVHPEGEAFYDASLRWPHEKQPSKPPEPWWQTCTKFTTLAVDLGQRDAGAYALLNVEADADFGNKPTRFIGESGEGSAKKQWRAALAASGMLRLPGEDRREWRDASKTEQETGTHGFGWREELFGERGRNATAAETTECVALLNALGASEEALMPPRWRETLSFPEQNDKLLVVARRAQSRLARFYRWAHFLADGGDEKRRGKALEEIADMTLPYPSTEGGRAQENQLEGRLRALVMPETLEELRSVLRAEISRLRELLPGLLVKIANRVLPLRGRSWRWEAHPAKLKCHLLDQYGAAREEVLLRGQRGLSLERIEQIEELRKRFQSLNQSLRREIGGKAPTRRDDSIPDPCPDLLEKLDRLKTQRVNQTAHMILAQALGVRLRTPGAEKSRLHAERDQHGEYEKFRAPVDFIVIEDLSRYRASQGRAPRENSRLMKWCHRAIRDKLKQMCEPFGLPVIETPAAWSSRFCARSGVPGFRAIEVHPAMCNEHPWAWQLKRLADFEKIKGTLDDKDREKQEEKLVEAREIAKVFADLECANRDVDHTKARPKWRTLYAPMTGGPLFIPLCDRVSPPDHGKLQPAIAQADINAAINLGLRAIADPRLWSIHPRLRSQREGRDGGLLTKEKRKYGATNALPITPDGEVKISEEPGRQPNFFFDVSGKIPWGRAHVTDPTTNQAVSVVFGAAMWKTVREFQWNRVREINRARLEKYQKGDDSIPM